MGRGWPPVFGREVGQSPAPGAILSAGGAPSAWPGLHVRWITGVVSVFLCAAVALTSATGFQRSIQLTQFKSSPDAPVTSARRQRVWTYSGILLAAIGTLAMALSVLRWGMLAQARAPSLFHQRFGLLDCPGSASWIISLCLFAIASVGSIRGSLIVRRTAMSGIA